MQYTHQRNTHKHAPYTMHCASHAGGNGAKVIQWGGGARQLYYYPKNTIQITNVGENVNKSEILGH